MSLVYAKSNGFLTAMGGAVNLNSIIETVASGSVAGVSSVSGVNGAVILGSSSDTVNVNVVGQTIDLSVNFPEPSGVLSLEGGTGALTFASTEGTINIELKGQEIDINTVGLATSGELATVSGVANTALANANNALALIPIYEYASFSGSTALTGTYADFASANLTTNTISCPILAWGTANITDNGSGSKVSVRLVIGGTQFGNAQTVDLTNGHSDSISPLSRGVGALVPGNISVKLQARVNNGSATITSAQTMCVANPILA